MKRVLLLCSIWMVGINWANAQTNVGIGTSTPITKLDVNGAYSARFSTAAAGATITIPTNVSLFRITAHTGVDANAVSVTTPQDGQYLTIINEDDDVATFGSYTIAANNGVGNFIYIGASSAWRLQSDNNTGSNSFTAGTGLKWSGNTLNSVWTQSGNDIYNNNAGNLAIGNTSPGSNLLNVSTTTVPAASTAGNGVTITAQQGGSSAAGGPVSITGGAGGSGNSAGGAVTVTAGKAAGTGTPGAVNIQGTTASGTTSAAAGDVNITGGAGAGTTSNGGSVNITAGTQNGGGANGSVNVSNGVANINTNSVYATNIGTGTATGAVNIGGTAAQTINVGAAGTSTNVQTVGVGSTSGASTTNINSGTGAVNINATNANNVNIANASSAGAVNIGKSNALVVNTSQVITAANLTGTGSRFVLADGSGNLSAPTSIGAGIVTGTGTPTQVAFWNSASALTSSSNLYWDNTNGRLGIATGSSPSTDIAMGGDANRSVAMERATGTTGFNLTVQAGGAKAAQTNRAGGDLVLSSGIATGTAGSNVKVLTATNGATGTADRAPTEKLSVLGNGNVGIGTVNLSGNVPLYQTHIYNATNTTTAAPLFVLQRNTGNIGTTAIAGFGHPYMTVGGDEYVNDATVSTDDLSYTIGFGWRTTTVNSTAEFGYVQRNAASNTIGDFIWGTRTLVTDATPSEKMRLTYDGNLGIGVAAPAQKMEVNGNGVLTGDLYIANSGTSAAGSIHYGVSGRYGQAASGYFVNPVSQTTNGLWIEGTQDGESGGIFLNGNSISMWSPGDNDILKVYDEDFFTTTAVAVPKFVINGSGYVGIGIASPSTPLEVAGSGTAELRISSTSGFGAAQLSFLSDKGSASEWRPGYIVSADGATVGTYTGRLDFYTNGTGSANKFASTYAMSIYNGRVGIGTTAPTAALEVQSSYGFNQGAYSFYAKGSSSPNTGNASCNPCNVSIYASQRVQAAEFDAYSDRRIKKDFAVSDNVTDLSTLKRLQVTDFKYKDEIEHGPDMKKGFIAQQVESVFPQAVQGHTGFITDIFELPASAKIVDGSLVLTMKNAHGLCSDEEVRLLTENGKKDMPVTVKDDYTFEVEHWNDTTTQVFVYGKKTTDFLTVDYDRIYTLNVGATQELVRKVEALEKENAQLKNSNTELSGKVNTLAASSASDIELLKKQIEDLRSLMEKNMIRSQR